jgi:hypothetical protein
LQNDLRSTKSLASSGPFFTSGPSNSFFTGPERLPFSAGFVPDLTQALFRPTLVPYNSTDLVTTTALTPTASSAQTAASTSTVTAPPAVADLTDRTAPTTAPFFAAIVSNNSFDGTEVPPGQQNLAVKTRQQRDYDSLALAPPRTDYFYDSQRLYTVKTTNSKQPGTRS